MLLDSRKYQLREPKLLDLSEVESSNDKGPLAIARSLEPGAYDIDLSKLEV
jgi:hypothetical protein